MDLVIVESPAKCKSIGKYLGSNYKVLASYGHIRDLPSRDGSVRPDEDFAMDYEISSDSAKRVKEISDAVKKSENIYLATDPDREGESISWHVLEALKERKALKKDIGVKRIVFNEITKRAVTEAVKNPRDIDMDLVNAQQARRALDYLVGFTLSPVLWRKLPGSKSAGRVQSVALRLICEREQEIETFVPKEYWTIHGLFANSKKDEINSKLTYYEGEKLDQFDINNEDRANEVLKALESFDYEIGAIEKKQVKRNPSPPFMTSTLQQEASRKLGFGASKTMSIAQKLYEGFEVDGETTGLITYMRTDGLNVAQEAITATRSLIKDKYGADFLPEKQRMYSSKAKNAQEAHEAIRPTDIKRSPESLKSVLSEEQLKLYTLIWKRMVASQMASALLDQVGVDINATNGKARFRATGSTIAFQGFFSVYKEDFDDKKSDDDEDRILPPLKEGESVDTKSITPEQHFTQPPPRYSEASLVKKLEELGIGRPSTYASIISVLQSRDYVRLEKKRFFPEERGRLVTTFLVNYFKRYVEYNFTANLEEELDLISEGKNNWKEVLRTFWDPFFANAEEIKGMKNSDIIESIDVAMERHFFPPREDGSDPRVCPTCDNGRLSLKVGKFGPFLGCSNYPECKHTAQIASADDASSSGDAGGEGGAPLNEPRELGKDPTTGGSITLKKGPYGFYLQLDVEGQDKPKRQGLPKQYNPSEVTEEIAIQLLSLPREVGKHPETGKVIKAGIGRFGPYLQHDSKYTSLKSDDVLTIGLNRAVSLIADSGKKKGAEPARIIGVHPVSEEEIGVYEGRYGPYIKHKKTNAPLPKDETIDSISLERAIELIEKKEQSKK